MHSYFTARNGVSTSYVFTRVCLDLFKLVRLRTLLALLPDLCKPTHFGTPLPLPLLPTRESPRHCPNVFTWRNGQFTFYSNDSLLWMSYHAVDFLYLCKFILQVIDGVCRVSYRWPSDEVKTAFGIGLLFFQFIIPFLVLIICYGKIVWMLTRRINTDLIKPRSAMNNTENVSNQTANAQTIKQVTDTAKDKFQLARRNTIKTLLIVRLCFIICWSQNQVRYLMHNCGYELDFNSTYFQFTVVMVFLNCTVNPFIYLIKYRDYQEALRAFFHCKKENENNSSSVTSITNPTTLSRA